MKNLFRSLLPYKMTALLVLLLMAGQAFCEMNLPQYTQDLIDTGIQNRGVEHILPEAVTTAEYGNLLSHMTDTQKSEMEDIYFHPDDNEDIYVRTALTEEELERLDEEMLEPVTSRYAEKTGGELTAGAETVAAEVQSEDAAASSETAEVQSEDVATSSEAADEKSTESQLAESAGTENADTAADDNQTLMAMGIAYAADCDMEAGIDILSIQNRYMWKCGSKMLLMSILVLVFTTLISLLAARVGAGVGRDLRSSLFTNVMTFSNAEIDNFQTSSLITRATNDIQQVQMTCTMILRMMLFAPCICTWSIIKVYQTHAHMNFIVVTGVIAILLMVALLFVIAMPKFKIMQTLVDGLNAVSREILTGIQVIRAFGREETEQKKFDEANTRLYKNQLFVNRTMISMTPMLMIIMYGLSIWITWVAAKRIDLGQLQVGTMTAFIAYSMEIVFSFLMIASMAIFLPRAGIAADRIYEVINTKTSIYDKEGAEDLPAPVDGTVRFEHVSFRYPDAEENVLTDIDFEARPGETTAIIGSTGCGKTTLIKLIPRFSDVTEGRITVGGKDVRDVTLHSLRDAIGYVPQKGLLFSGTVGENLRWGKADADDEEVRQAAEISQAARFIEEKPGGYDREISQGGANVSGGQKQRIAIARALIKDPAILIFDDSFSALDMKTDVELRKALAEKTADAAKIIVAQRVGTILNAEQIIVLDEGRIAGKGTHRELMKNCDVYREIALSQLSEAELA